jgi:hypothetical protein
MWRRDAIESYLVVPRVMARLVVGRRSDLSLDDVVSYIEQARDQVIDDLEDETFDRVSNRYRRDVIARDGRNVEPSEVNKHARKVVRDRDQLARLTRGKDLLASLKRRSRRSIECRSGTRQIVSEMTIDDIDPELIEVLDQIEKLAME